MQPTVNDKITAKLCLACPLSGELRMHLRASESWAQANVGIPEEQALRELRYQNKEFVGFLVDTPILSLLDLSALKEKLHDVLSEHCPELPKNTIQPQLFPQVYIA